MDPTGQEGCVRGGGGGGLHQAFRVRDQIVWHLAVGVPRLEALWPHFVTLRDYPPSPVSNEHSGSDRILLVPE